MAAAAEFLTVVVNNALGEDLKYVARFIVETRWLPLVKMRKIKLDIVLEKFIGAACKNQSDIDQRRRQLPTRQKIHEVGERE